MDDINNIVGLSRAPLSSDDIQTILKLADSEHLASLTLCAGHPLLVRMASTLSDPDTEAEGKAKTLKLLALLSRNAANSEALTAVLDECGEALEKFLAVHHEIDGHRDTLNDEIHKEIVSFLICSSDYSFRGSQLLELTDRKMRKAVGILAAVLRGPFGLAPMDTLVKGEQMRWEAEVKLITCATRVLADLTFCDTYFQSADTRDYQNTDIKVLTREFENNIAEVTKAILEFPIIDIITVQLDQWFGCVQKGGSAMESLMKMCGTSPASRPPQSDPMMKLLCYLEIGISNVLLLLCNLVFYTTEYSAQLRKHLGSQTIFIQNLVLPYTVFLIDSMNLKLTPSDEARPELHLEAYARQLLHITKVLSFLTLRVRSFREWFKKHDFTKRVLALDVIMESNIKTEMVAQLAKLNANIDILELDPVDGPGVVKQLVGVYDQMSPHEKSDLNRKLNTVDKMYPVNRFSKTFKEMSALWTEEVDEVEADDKGPVFKFQFEFTSVDVPVSKLHAIPKKSRVFLRQSGRGKRAKTYAFSAKTRLQQRFKDLKKKKEAWLMRKKAARCAEREAQEVKDEAEEEEEEEDEEEVKKAELEEKEEEAAPLCQKDTAERRKELHEMSKYDAPTPKVDPLLQKSSAAGGTAFVCRPSKLAPMEHAKGVKMNTFFGNALAQPVESQEATVTETRILFQAGTKPADPSEQGEEAEGVPSRFLCSLTHQVMKNPVVTPHGYLYDRSAITKWLLSSSYCPNSGKELTLGDLVEDRELRREIQAFHLQSSFERST